MRGHTRTTVHILVASVTKILHNSQAYKSMQEFTISLSLLPVNTTDAK